jgi:hypothetical protein
MEEKFGFRVLDIYLEVTGKRPSPSDPGVRRKDLKSLEIMVRKKNWESQFES